MALTVIVILRTPHGMSARHIGTCTLWATLNVERRTDGIGADS